MVLTVSIILLFILLYCSVILLLSTGIGRLRRDSALSTKNPVPVTVIIPFRNEEDRIPNLVGDLLRQSYSDDQFEVIFVNDHSQDGSKALLNSLISTKSHFICLDMPQERSGKKEALYFAVQHTRSEWIIQTDADCRLGPNFIASHMAFHEAHPSDMVAGLVTTRNESGSFLESFERLDLLSLVGVGAGSFHFGRPMMCNGANLAYSKDLFLTTRQFDPAKVVSSGDDMFLMIGARKLGKKLSYNITQESMVETWSVRSPGALISQHIRWGSKALHYKMTDIQLLALVVVLTNLLILLIPVFILMVPGGWPWLVSAFVLKTLTDFNLLYRITGYTGQRRSLRMFLPVSLLYYIFQLAIVTGSLFNSPGWKGKRI